MKRRFGLFGTMALAAGLLVGCGNNDNNGEAPTNGGSDSLVIYSNSLTDERSAWLESIASEAGFDLNLVSISGGDLPNRLIAEQNNPIADIVFGLNHVGFETLKSHGILTPFVPTWADEIEEGLNDSEGYYHSTIKQAIILIYNKAYMSDENAPTDWTDLWENPAFDGQHFINNSLGGGTIRTAIAGILVRYQDPNGVYGISEEGWDALRGFFEQGHIGREGEDFFASLANGTTPINTIWTGGIQERVEEFGVDFGIVNPEIGVPLVVEQIGIISGTDNEELAQEFVEWFGSAEIQGQWAAEFAQLPANINAVENAPVFLRDIHNELKTQEIDWEFVTANMDNWITKIELDILP